MTRPPSAARRQLRLTLWQCVAPFRLRFSVAPCVRPLLPPLRDALCAAVVAALGVAAVAAQGGSPAPRPSAARSVHVDAIAGVVQAGAAWQTAWAGRDNADGLVGAADGSLLFAQEQPSRVSAIAPDGRVSVLVDQTHGAGALAIDARGRIFAAQRTCTDPGLHAPCNEPTAIGIVYPQSERRTLANMVDGHSLGRVNDLVVGRSGNIYFTSGGAYFLNAGGTVTAFGQDLRTNGIILSRDGKTLYVTNGSTIAAFDVGSDGTPSKQRAFAMLAAGGSGDGMTIDDDGRIYVTSPPGVQVFDASGRYVGLIPTPRPVISAAFAGTDKRTLYVVGSGAADESGHEIVTPEGVRNNAKTIYRLPMASRGFRGRPK